MIWWLERNEYFQNMYKFLFFFGFFGAFVRGSGGFGFTAMMWGFALLIFFIRLGIDIYHDCAAKKSMREIEARVAAMPKEHAKDLYVVKIGLDDRSYVLVHKNTNAECHLTMGEYKSNGKYGLNKQMQLKADKNGSIYCIDRKTPIGSLDYYNSFSCSKTTKEMYEEMIELYYESVKKMKEYEENLIKENRIEELEVYYNNNRVVVGKPTFQHYYHRKTNQEKYKRSDEIDDSVRGTRADDPFLHFGK